jgi:hypothetical protein
MEAVNGLVVLSGTPTQEQPQEMLKEFGIPPRPLDDEPPASVSIVRRKRDRAQRRSRDGNTSSSVARRDDG